MLLLKIILSGLKDLNDSLGKDTRIATYPLLGSPLGMLMTLSAYLILVLKLGPRLMKNRKPFKLEGLIKIYNVIQIVVNLAIFLESLRYSYLRKDFKTFCEPYDISDRRPGTMNLIRPALWYYYSKYLDLFDTIFFLLRKKYNQISFLHVYHHCLVVIGVYLYCSVLFGTHFTITGVLNSFVHVVMYAYYLVAAMKLNLDLSFWKITLTRIQLLQFAYFAFHYTIPFINDDCDYPLIFKAISFIQNIMLMLLFGNFYYNAYISKSNKPKLPENVK